MGMYFLDAASGKYYADKPNNNNYYAIKKKAFLDPLGYMLSGQGYKWDHTDRCWIPPGGDVPTGHVAGSFSSGEETSRTGSPSGSPSGPKGGSSFLGGIAASTWVVVAMLVIGGAALFISKGKS